MSPDRSETDNSATAERTNNTLKAYREIRRRILDGEMPGGSQFLEQELAELLNMSRTPVREAMIRLAEERLVEVRPRHGVRILPVTPDDIREIYELLTEIEVFAVRRIAERGLRNEDYVALTDAVAEMEAAQKNGDIRRWATAERSFHEILIAASGNSKAYDLVRMLGDQSQQARMRILSDKIPFADIARGHSDLIDALRRQNPIEAQELKRQQLVRAGKHIVELLKSDEQER